MGALQNLLQNKKLLAIVGGGVGLVVVLIIVLMMTMGGGKKQEKEAESWTVLFRKMDGISAGEAAGKLQEAKIESKLLEDGTAIAVKKENADKARIALSLAGLPKNAEPGFEIFNKKDFISTDFDKKISFLRALKGELKRLVKQIDGVEDAAVIVNLPEDTLFQTERKPTTAAVMVVMQRGRSLNPMQVEGIQHLVASSVPGLLTDNVTVTDKDGHLLSSGMEANAGNKDERSLMRALNEQMKVTRQMEADLENRLTSLLDKLVGSGKSVVRVKLELDFNKRQVMNQLLAPVLNNGEPVAVNRTLVEERNGSPTNGGVPGVASNVPTYPALPSEVGGDKESYRKNLREQQALSMERQLVNTASGNIKRMSIAVLLPEAVKPEGLERLRLVIATAAGADQARRDQVTVERVKFDTSLEDALKKELDDKEAANKKPKGKSVSWGLVWAAGGGLLLIFLLIAFIRRATRKQEDPLAALTALSGESEALPTFDQSALAGIPPGFGQMGFDQDALGGQMGYDQGLPGGDPYANMQYEEPAMMAPQAQPMGGAFDFLYEVAPEQVAELLGMEKPQSVAGVLAQLDPGYAEQVLNYLSPDIQQEVFNRLNSGASLPAMTQKMLSQSLRRKLGVPV
ncbi:Flagellar M-ring protein [compost metagenome]